MKKALAVLVVINSLFVFRLALQQYDVLVFNNITTFAPDPEVYYFAISGELDESETREFQKYFIELLDKYNLNCYQRFDIDHDLIIWLYTDDEWYLHNIPLTEGALTSVSPGEYYFSNDGEAKGVIYNPIRNENFKIYYLDDFSNGNKSVFYPYHLVTYDENKDYIYAAFTADIKAAYPNLSFTTMLLHLHMGNQNAPFLQEMLFVALTASMVVLGLNAILSKKTKAIQLMKLEGYSTKDIFNKHVLRQIVLVFLINVLATTSLYYSIIETSLSNALPLIYNLAVSLVMLIFVLLSLSTVTLAVILSINANLAVKGKSPLKKWKSLNYLLRVMLILFTASYTINSAYAVFRFLRLEATEDQYLERIENLYTASYVKPQYVGTKSQQNVSFELDTIQALLEKLKGNNGFFFYMGGSPLRVTGLYDEIPLIFASKEYVEQFISNELAAQFADTGKYILIPESLEASTGQIVGHLESEYFSFSGEGLGEVVYYNDDLFPV
ncbi:MAG: hypothetical protein FWH40_01655, partial [Coriobacteriia bacterium]|nr:hypothetical protein [Coriobacteriia bacterium]